jgi:hypothetical protein
MKGVLQEDQRQLSWGSWEKKAKSHENVGFWEIASN